MGLQDEYGLALHEACRSPRWTSCVSEAQINAVGWRDGVVGENFDIEMAAEGEVSVRRTARSGGALALR